MMVFLDREGPIVFGFLWFGVVDVSLSLSLLLAF